MLHLTTVEPNTLDLLKRLMKEPFLTEFNLVGGTALSLQIGHRRSIDLDMFSHEVFETDDLLAQLLEAGYTPQVRFSKQNTLITEIEGVKVDFIRFRYPFSQAIQHLEGIRLASIQDIACMKVDAIAGRGKRKDFFDLYCLLQDYSLTQIMAWYAEMYKHSTLFHIYKSLVWFEDADNDAEIDRVGVLATWNDIKAHITEAVETAI